MAYRPKDANERIVHRLKIAKGHLEKVLRMTENGEYCIDIIHQSQAIQKALKQIDNLILANHLEGCVTDSIKNGSPDEAIAEVLQVFKKSA